MTLKTTIFLLGIAITLTTVSGLKCYVSRGYQSLEELNKNKANPEQSRQCNSTYRTVFSSCFVARYGNEELGRYGCLGRGDDLETFFRKLVRGERRDSSPYYGPLVDQLISKTKAKVDVSMPGVKLVGTGSTNFKTLLDKTLLNELQEVNINIVAKVDELSIKLKMTGDFTSAYKAFMKLTSGCLGGRTHKCPSGRCIPTRFVCDGYNDCGDRSDEQNCSGPGSDYGSGDYPYPEAEAEPEDSHSSYLSEILDVFDGPFGIIEQSIVGNVKDTYKKVKHLINWVETNMKHRGPYDRDTEWSSHGNETIDFGVKLHVTVGTENEASIRLTGEAHDFVKGYIGMKMEGNLEFCDDDGKCSRFGVCRTDLCNTFKPLESNDIPVV